METRRFASYTSGILIRTLVFKCEGMKNNKIVITPLYENEYSPYTYDYFRSLLPIT